MVTVGAMGVAVVVAVAAVTAVVVSPAVVGLVVVAAAAAVTAAATRLAVGSTSRALLDATLSAVSAGQRAEEPVSR